MYFALILQHIKLSLDVLALKIYIHILLKIQKLCAVIASHLINLSEAANNKASDTITAY